MEFFYGKADIFIWDIIYIIQLRGVTMEKFEKVNGKNQT